MVSIVETRCSGTRSSMPKPGARSSSARLSHASHVASFAIGKREGEEVDKRLEIPLQEGFRCGL